MSLYHTVLFCMASCFCISTLATWAPNCCLKTSTQKHPAKRFAYYTVHRAGICPIYAVAFWTHRNRKMCYDPDLDWVKKIMKEVGPRTEEKKGTSPVSETSPKPNNNSKKSQKGRKKGRKHRKNPMKQ